MHKANDLLCDLFFFISLRLCNIDARSDMIVVGLRSYQHRMVRDRRHTRNPAR